MSPDVEAWFQQDNYKGKPHIVAQWAEAHNSLAQAWVKADLTHAAYVDAWTKAHKAEVVQWIKDNPETPQPVATDLAVIFFESFSKENPGKFPAAVTKTGADGKTQTTIEPVKEGADIQATFFDMWREDHAAVELQDVPGDMVTTSGSGLDPHITLNNAKFQLDRVAGKWAANLKRDPTQVRGEIEQMLQGNASAPFAGLIGEKMVNVLEVNLQLRQRYGAPSS